MEGRVEVEAQLETVALFGRKQATTAEGKGSRAQAEDAKQTPNMPEFSLYERDAKIKCVLTLSSSNICENTPKPKRKNHQR